MKRALSEENRDAKRSYVVKQEGVPFGYDTYVTYASTASTPTTVNQPLPGQPPLPPMPPPPGAMPPPPHVFVPHSQVSPIQTWTHAPPPWQWIAQQQATALSSQTIRDITTNFQRDIPLRGNFIRRERFNNNSNGSGSNNNNRNNMYNQRNNFQRTKNHRRTQRFDSAHGQFDQNYFGAAAATMPGGIGLDWQRNNFSTTPNEGITTRMNPVNIPNLMNNLKSGIANRRTEDDSENKVVSEEIQMKKNKQRKPMSQSYPSRPWNRADAQRALSVESEYNSSVRAQSLIIKFPDPDLNKDIVREFHPGIQNIHFQSPSGPRYCFIQMADNVDIDEAIRELESVAFGVGHLRVEKKSQRDDDNPLPEEIDPYTLYVGNLPESVNVNEVKNKFSTAVRIDVGHAQKMRNTRYAFIRYNTVDESISAYRRVHNLMWDTRSVIVRFRRQRGNTCLPTDQKNLKKVKEEAANAAAANKSKQNNQNKQNTENDVSKNNKCDSSNSNSPDMSIATTSTSSDTNSENTQSVESTSENCQSNLENEKDDITTTLITDIKEEPQDYEEMDLAMGKDDDDDDDDDEEEEQLEEEIEEDEEMGDNEDQDDDGDDDDDDDDEDECLDKDKTDLSEKGGIMSEEEEIGADGVQSDNLDRLFNDLENISSDMLL